MNTSIVEEGMQGPELVHAAETLLATFAAHAAVHGIPNQEDARAANALRKQIAENRETFGMQAVKP